MIDTNLKPIEPDVVTSESQTAVPPAAVTEPVVEPTPAPVAGEPLVIEAPQPAPEIVAVPSVKSVEPIVPPDSLPLPLPDAVTSPLPDPAVTPESPPTLPEEPAVTAPTQDIPQTEPPVAPTTHLVGSIPPTVLALTDDELKAAARYYIQKHQREIGLRGVRARQAQQQKMLDAITAYVKARGSVQIPRLCQDMNISPGLASHYLRLLVIDKTIKADGWAKSRRFYT